MYQLECSGYLLWRIPQFEVVRDFPPKYIPRLQSAFKFWPDIKSAGPILSRNGFVSPRRQRGVPESVSSQGEPSHFSLILEL